MAAPLLAGPAAAALASLTPTQLTFIHSLPKAELHAHLNGSIPLSILQNLASTPSSSHNESELPNESIQLGLDKLRKGVTLDTISDFFGLFPAIYALTSSPDALRSATLGVLDAFFGGSSSASGSNTSSSPSAMTTAAECTYMELRTTPRETKWMTREVYLRTVLDAVTSFFSSSSAESVDDEKNIPNTNDSHSHCGVTRKVLPVGVIASLDRRMSKEVMHEIVDIAIKLKRKEGFGGIVGVDLCGDPTAGDVEDFREVFKKAKEAGLGVTLHIAETLENSPEETLKLLSFKPDRLGHATFLDEEAKKIVLENKICIEICLTSNLLCKTVPDLDSHHIRYWLQHQHPIAICTDDILPFRNSLTAEYALLLAKPPLGLGLTEDEVRMIARMSLDSRFSMTQ